MDIRRGKYDERAHKNQISIHQAQQQRGRHRSNIWVFDSPKINKRFVIHGDVAFMHIILLEGNAEVSHYDPEPGAVFVHVDGEQRKTTLDAVVYFQDGHEEWWEFKRAIDAGHGRRGRSRPQLTAQAQAASEAGVKYEVKTELDLAGKEVLFDNWLVLCSIITRAHGQPNYREKQLLIDRFDRYTSVTVGSLINNDDIDPALMLSVIASDLQAGRIQADLEKSLFGLDTILQRSEK